ncbi:hypothetical protein [Aminobacter sp. Piv2-1]|uniref:hypothetical protein n=1 Tax=Aminobacter sp. Piv2-1 TaxID=3031122 RepID=UPI0030B79E70
MQDPAQPAKPAVVMAFNRDEQGGLTPAFPPREMQNQDAAVRFAKMIEDHHAGVVVWVGSTGTPADDRSPEIVLYRHGDVPGMG